MEAPNLTRGQLERRLSQQIQALYREHLGHRLGKVSCEIFNKELAILMEDSFTHTEQLLAKEGRDGLAEEVRADIDEVIRPKIKALIEDTLGISVIDLLSDATIQTGRSGIIAVLETTPSFRDSKSGKSDS